MILSAGRRTPVNSRAPGSDPLRLIELDADPCVIVSLARCDFVSACVFLPHSLRHPGYTRGMSIVLPALGVAFAAFCIWLAVRIINRRERWAKWSLAVILTLPMLYPLSFGPACWSITRAGRNQSDTFECIFWPIGWCAENGPVFVHDVVEWYAMLGAPRGGTILIPSSSTLDAGFVITE
jgi:hypothetical protein